jgi:hypothetical protein
MNRARLLADLVRAFVRAPQASLTAVTNSDELARRDLLRTHGFDQLPTIDILDLFPSFEQEVCPYSFLEGTSLISDLALLRLLTRRYATPSYLEIGTWRGESLANVAATGAACTTISLSADEMRERGFGEQFIAVHEIYSKDLTHVRRIEHDSTTYNFGNLEDRFDLVFVDGDHDRAAVTADTENVFNVLRDDRSVIVWHDYGWSPERVRPAVLAGILDGCPPEAIEHVYHVSNTLCAIYIRGDFNTRRLRFPQTPNKVFRAVVSGRPLESRDA